MAVWLANGSRMHSIALLLVLACSACSLYTHALSASSDPTQPVFRVAIIGSGIGGSACAHFLRNMTLALDPAAQLRDAIPESFNPHIDVYERAPLVGGRMSHVDIDGERFETGANIFVDQNRYIAAFTELLDLDPIKPIEGHVRLGIWDVEQKAFSFVQSSYSLWSQLQLLIRYNPFHLYALKAQLATTLDKWMRLYDLQQKGVHFESVRYQSH